MKTIGWKAVRPDLTTDGNGQGELTRWYPGTTLAPGGALGGPCPRWPGDGVCLAKTPKGARYVGSLSTVVIVTYDETDVLGEDEEKLRVSRCTVLDVWDAQRILCSGARANLCYANLRGADLRYANLCYANLRYANLRGANLRDANLRGADLCYANLRGADLRDANLYGANLSGANLRDANLRGADLYGAVNPPP